MTRRLHDFPTIRLSADFTVDFTVDFTLEIEPFYDFRGLFGKTCL
jgi:hypothetical protein